MHATTAIHIGHLTLTEYKQAARAYQHTKTFLPWLRIAGYVTFAENPPVKNSTTGHIGIPSTKIAYLEIQRILQALNAYPDIETAAHDLQGASHLLDLRREMRAATIQWPMQEKPHKVTLMRCGDCEQLTLWYKPPRHYGDPQRIDCPCGYTLIGEELTWAVEVLQQEHQEKTNR